MLKEVIGKIIEAENLAQRLENDALIRAENILNNATLNANQLKTQPCQDAIDKASQILSHANATAQNLIADKINAAGDFHFDSNLIDSAADTIVDLFLKRGL